LAGGEKDIKPITVITYDSCYLMAPQIGNRFKLVIFDEVHHLGGEGYATMAEMLACPHRLGLTATYERHDGRHTIVDRLVGGKVYEVGIEELEGTYLAEYDYKLIKLNMTPDEKKNYDAYYDRYRKLAAELKLNGAEGFQKMITLSVSDARAREALVCRNKARDIAFNSEVKITALESLLQKHKYDRIIIFTEHNKLVHLISKSLLIPSITHETPPKEREYNLEAFRNGIFTRLVTSKVLDEGVDVPEANVGIILSGSGSVREYKQRLGRILRMKEGKEAVLYEIVTANTGEVGTSMRRHSRVRTAVERVPLAAPGIDSNSNSNNTTPLPAPSLSSSIQGE
jgi:superfamily II DNA or RNA helicase